MSALLEFQIRPPAPALAHVVEHFWMLRSPSASDQKVIVLPDGRIDLFLTKSNAEPFQIALMGLGTEPGEGPLTAGMVMFAVVFKLLASEYVFGRPLAKILNSGERLPDDFWGFGEADLADFEAFCRKAEQKIQHLLPPEMDERKRRLFELVYASDGAMPVRELAEKSFWSSRQINRYFQQQFGLSLKAYCDILRFRAAFAHIKAGRLFPEGDFFDQAHFIREVKKLAGTVPKNLHRNADGRFIQFSLLPD